MSWQFEPAQNEGPQITTKVVRAHALFFLHKNEEGNAYEVIRAGFYTLPMGGYFLPVPSGPLQSPFLYAPGSSFEVKLAGELGAALEAIAVKEGDALDVYYAPPPYGGPAPPPKAPREDVDQFQSLCLLFNELDAQAAADVAHYFAASPVAHLQAIGLIGELKLKESSAILAAERNMDALGRTEMAFQIGYASLLDLHDKPDEINAVGRKAIAESAWFGFDNTAVHTLTRADGLVAVPYLRVMLDNPRPEIRAAALEGLCSVLVRNGEPVEGICPVWHADPYRGDGLGGSYSTPQGNEAERSQKIKTWLSVHHPELPQLNAPAWYHTPAPAPPEEVAISPERHRKLAFNILLARLTIHSEPAAAGLKLSSSDAQTLSEITAQIRKQLQTSYDVLQKANGAARLANKNPDPMAFCRHAAEVEHILTGGLAELESSLSLSGREVLDVYLDHWPVHQYVAGSGGKHWFNSASSGSACNSN